MREAGVPAIALKRYEGNFSRKMRRKRVNGGPLVERVIARYLIGYGNPASQLEIFV